MKVKWEYDNIWKNKIHVPNHQPNMIWELWNLETSYGKHGIKYHYLSKENYKMGYDMGKKKQTEKSITNHYGRIKMVTWQQNSKHM